MSIQELQTEIQHLPPDEIASLAKWLDDYSNQLWDEEIACDLDEGKLDAILDDVDREYKAGLVRAL